MLDFIPQPYCRTCGVAFDISTFEDFYCAKMSTTKTIYDCARSLLKFNQGAKKIIHKFKYHDNTEIAKIFARLICD